MPNSWNSTTPVVIATTMKCNLRCPYCFEGDARSCSARDLLSGMTPQTSSRVISFLRDIALRRDHRLNLRLFGGEPLMNYRACIELLEGLQGVLTVASTQSNGTLLTQERAAELASLGVREMHITFDGDASHRDSQRVYSDGRGTYAQILDRISASADFFNWVFRVNVGETTLDGDLHGLRRLIDDLSDLMPGSHRALVYLAPITESTPGAREPRQDDLQRDARRIIDFSGYALERGLKVNVPRARDQSAAPCAFCGERSIDPPEITIGPSGHLYSSWDSLGRTDGVVGHVAEGYNLNMVMSRWRHCAEGKSNNHALWAQGIAALTTGPILDLLESYGLLGPRGQMDPFL